MVLCLPATDLTWGTSTPGFGAVSGDPVELTPQADRGILTYQPADVNGDGNLDLVWLEWDADAGGDTDHHLKYAISDGSGLTAATFADGARSIELYEDVEAVQQVRMRTVDYNGDGRSDVILWRTGDPLWKVYLSAPQTTGGWKLDATPAPTDVADAGAEFSDLNGDGLVDAFYSRGRSVYARYLAHDADAESPEPVASSQYYEFGDEVPLYTRPPSGTPGGIGTLSIVPEASNYDFNGDGRADILAKFTSSLLGAVVNKSYRPLVIGADGAWSAYAAFYDDEVHAVDLNRDGLTDLIRGERTVNDSDDIDLTVRVAINTGSGFDSRDTGIVLDATEVKILDPMDYNRDGHPDFVWHDREARRIKAYLWNPNTNAMDTATPHTVRTTNGSRKRAHLFFDANGDGHTDYFRLTELSDDSKLYTYLANDTGSTPGAVTRIENGLGAQTDIAYETLSRTDHYERLGLGGTPTTSEFCFSFLGASGCYPYTRTTVSGENIDAFYSELNSGWNLPAGAQTLGKVGPVLEFTGPVSVVTRVQSSAPAAGASPDRVDDSATSAIEYFYADAKVQAMGRGLLGFGQLKTRDPQTDVETTTAYRHDFPFTGLPVSTRSELPVKVTEDVDGDGVPTTMVVRRRLSESTTTWKLTGFAAGTDDEPGWAATAQAAGTAALGALKPYASQVVEKTYDLNGGAHEDPDLVSTVITDSAYDDHGNATSMTVTATGGGSTFVTGTVNEYGPADADRQLGRLTRTTVTKQRNEDADEAWESESTRVSAFSYYGQTGCPYTGAAHAGLLCQETVEPDRPAFKVTTTHRYDAFGNRRRAKIEYFDDTPTPGGDPVAGADRIQTRCDKDTAAYDGRGRFVTWTADCLGRRVSEVMGRDAHGLPTSVRRYLDGARSAYVTDTVAYTSRGLEVFRTSDTGAYTLTTRSGDDPDGDAVQCPANTAFHERVTAGGGGDAVACFDRLARAVRTATKGFDGTWVYTDTEYDRLGRVKRLSEPYYAGQTACAAETDATTANRTKCWTTSDYDILGRVTRTVGPDGSTAQIAHEGLDTTTTNALRQTRTETRNVLGETIVTEDHDGGTVAFTYDAQGNLTHATRRKPGTDATSAPASVITSMTYDAVGNKTGMTDPDKGTSGYRYNALGELTCRQSAAGHFTVMRRDGLGRTIVRQDYRAHAGAGCAKLTAVRAASLEADAAWRYDTAANGLGQLGQTTDAQSGYRRTLAYDAYGRPSTAQTVPGAGNGTHHEKTTYDQYGRIFQVFDASRTTAEFTHSGVRHVYNANGYLARLQDAVGTEDDPGTFTSRKIYRTVTAMDARGNVTTDRLGNGVTRSHTFDTRTGRVRTIGSTHAMAGTLQALDYDWDTLGNLTSRERMGDGTTRTEEFCYDELNRLTRSRRTSRESDRSLDLCATGLGRLTGIDTVTYDGYGNIRTKSGVGTYAYGSDAGAPLDTTAGPHAVASVTKADNTQITYTYDANGNNTASSDGRRIAYTTFDKPSSIDKGSHATAFAYDPDRSRFKRTDTTAITEGTGDDATTTMLTTTTLYVGSVERITRPNSAVQIKRHIGGVAIETIGSADGGCDADDATALQYVLRDHLGSVDVLTDAMGREARSMSFDAWGRRRNAATWQDLTDTAAMTFDHCATTRGFTNHEMLDEVGVVHMNGRIYDPTLARFLQADPYVQFPSNLQNHNRYSYVMNNPLSYTDPTGYFLGDLLRPLASIAISIWLPGAGFWTGSVLFAANGVGAVAVSGFVAGAVASGNLKGAVMGAFSAAAFHGIGGLFEGRFVAETGKDALGRGLTAPGLALKSAFHGLAGGVMGVLQGGKFGHGFLSGAATQAATGRIDGLQHGGHRVLAAAILGGTVSAATGGKFANGAITGAFSRAFNDELHGEDGASEVTDEALVIGIRGFGTDKSGGNPGLIAYVDELGGEMMSEDQARKSIQGAASGTRIELYGYSRGGNAVIDLVNWAGKNDIFIHRVVTIDPHRFVNSEQGFLVTSPLVGEVINYYQRNPRTLLRGTNRYRGSPVRSQHSHVAITQLKLTGKPLIYHTNIVNRFVRDDRAR